MYSAVGAARWVQRDGQATIRHWSSIIEEISRMLDVEVEQVRDLWPGELLFCDFTNVRYF